MTTSLLVFFGGGQEKAEYRFRYPADEGGGKGSKRQ